MRRTRVAILFAIAVLSLAGQDRYFDLLHISDTHVGDLKGVHPELVAARKAYQDTGGEKLARFVQEAAVIPNSRVVHTGDIVDAVCWESEDPAQGLVYGQIELVKKLVAALPATPLLVLGNHDVECYRRNPQKKNAAVADQSVAAETRRLWGQAFAGLRTKSYFAEPLKVGARRYWLIALDNGEALATGREFFEEQMRWLERELARHPGEPAILALHIPIAADEKSQAIRERLAKSDRVRLILTGHRHSDLLDEVEVGEQRILQVRTAGLHISSVFWRRVRLYEDRIEVSGTGHAEEVLRRVPIRR